MPSRTRVKKEGKRMSFIFQFFIVSRAWQLFWPSKKGSFGWFWERKSKSRGAAGFGRENLKAGERRLLVLFGREGKV